MKTIFKLILLTWSYISNPLKLIALIKFLLSLKSMSNALADLIFKLTTLLLRFVFILRKFSDNNMTLITAIYLVLQHLRQKFNLPVIFKYILILLQVLTYMSLIAALTEMNGNNIQGILSFIKNLSETLQENFLYVFESINNFLAYIFNLIREFLSYIYALFCSIVGINNEINEVSDIDPTAVQNLPAPQSDASNAASSPGTSPDQEPFTWTEIAFYGLTAAACIYLLLWYFDPDTTSNLNYLMYEKYCYTSLVVRKFLYTQTIARLDGVPIGAYASHITNNVVTNFAYQGLLIAGHKTFDLTKYLLYHTTIDPSTTLSFLRLGEHTEIPPFPDTLLLSPLSSGPPSGESMILNEVNLNRFFPNPFAPDSLEAVTAPSPTMTDIGSAWDTDSRPLSTSTPEKNFEIYYGPESPSKVKAVLDGASSSLQVIQDQNNLSNNNSSSSLAKASDSTSGVHKNVRFLPDNSPESSDSESSDGSITPTSNYKSTNRLRMRKTVNL